MNYRGHDINTATTPRPWGAREEQCWKDTLDSLYEDTVTGTKATTHGHHHSKLYSETTNNLTLQINQHGFIGINCQPGNWDTDFKCVIEMLGASNQTNHAISSNSEQFYISSGVYYDNTDNRWESENVNSFHRMIRGIASAWEIMGRSFGVAEGDQVDWSSTSVNRLMIDGGVIGTVINYNMGNYNTIIRASGKDNAFFVNGANGFIGIGTDSPDNELEIVKDQNTHTLIRVINTTDSVSATAGIDAVSYGDNRIGIFACPPTYIPNRFQDKGVLLSDQNSGLIINQVGNEPIEFHTNDANRVTITGDGNIGINTSAPLNNIVTAAGDLSGLGLHIKSDTNERAYLIIEGDSVWSNGLSTAAAHIIMADYDTILPGMMEIRQYSDKLQIRTLNLDTTVNKTNISIDGGNQYITHHHATEDVQFQDADEATWVQSSWQGWIKIFVNSSTYYIPFGQPPG